MDDWHRFPVIGPQSGTASEAAGENEIARAFDPAFQSAGLDRNAFQPIASIGTPRVGCDRRFAWVGSTEDDTGKTVRVEVATLYAKPVYFERLPTAKIAASQIDAKAESSWSAAVLGAFVPIVRIGTMIACVFFAQRNLRLGRSDRRAATRLGVAVFLIALVARLLVAEHWGAGRDVYFTMSHLLGMSLFRGVFALTLYLAVEPFVRRAWPERIVSMTPLLSGRLTDPLIGRDLLIGLLIGTIAPLLFYLIGIVCISYGLAFGTYWGSEIMNTTLSMRHTLGGVLNLAAHAANNALWVLFLLVVALAVCRRRQLATAGVVAVLFLYICSWPEGGDFIPAVLVGVVWTASYSVAILRFVLLTLLAAFFTEFVAVHFFVTFNFAVWNIGNIWFANAILIGLAVFGFVTATRGQTLLKDEVFDSATGTSS